ncbi:MAG: arsenosugar biosynthesis radical SAM (seleno)protein ArsS [Bacteroidota bacterium]
MTATVFKSLRSRQHPLAPPSQQVEFLQAAKGPAFHQLAAGDAMKPMTPEILQVNIGYQCNQTCRHCHVDAGPDRREIMTEVTMEHCLAALRTGRFTTLDITGGAPEMHANFRWFAQQAAATEVKEIIVRSNLTIIVANPFYHDLPEFFKAHRVRVCSSLPFHSAARTDRQRGEGVFEKSIRALKMLNAAGYGVQDSGLILDLVYNPAGAFLPAAQADLEQEFRAVLAANHGITFNHLLTITNVPVSRFLEFLVSSGNFEGYMEKLVSAFNPATLPGLMCRNTVSVDWQGNLYDCDFNQMLALRSASPVSHISDFNAEQFSNRKIVTGRHCFACTAGAGSSCQGTLA